MVFSAHVDLPYHYGTHPGLLKGGAFSLHTSEEEFISIFLCLCCLSVSLSLSLSRHATTPCTNHDTLRTTAVTPLILRAPSRPARTVPWRCVASALLPRCWSDRLGQTPRSSRSTYPNHSAQRSVVRRAARTHTQPFIFDETNVPRRSGGRAFKKSKSN